MRVIPTFRWKLLSSYVGSELIGADPLGDTLCFSVISITLPAAPKPWPVSGRHFFGSENGFEVPCIVEVAPCRRINVIGVLGGLWKISAGLERERPAGRVHFCLWMRLLLE